MQTGTSQTNVKQAFHFLEIIIIIYLLTILGTSTVLDIVLSAYTHYISLVPTTNLQSFNK